MRIQNVDLSKPNVETCTIYRNGKPIVFKAQSVFNNADFDKLCPVPKRETAIVSPAFQNDPEKIAKIKAEEDQRYVTQLEVYNEMQNCWLYKESLKATEDIVWDNVIDDDPKTWLNVNKELEALTLTDAERTKITLTIYKAQDVNSLGEEAEKSFFDEAQAGVGEN